MRTPLCTVLIASFHVMDIRPAVPPQDTFQNNGLAVMYKNLGRLTEAEELARQAVKAQETNAAPPARIAGTMKDLALVLFAEGKYQDAETLLHVALSKLEISSERTTVPYAEALTRISHELLAKGRPSWHN